MTRTIRVVLSLSLLLGIWCDTLTAGAHKDFEKCVIECGQCLEGINNNTAHFLDLDSYEAATIELIPSKISEKLTFPSNTDPRIEQVRRFFVKYHSPAAKYARVFIQVADENDLDWRLLPAFAFVETGGGKYHYNNNMFGWASGRTRFNSMEDGIRQVGHALQVYPYRNKTTIQKIRVYNTRKHYITVIERVMGQIEKIQLSS